jgi:ribosome-binding ATPase
MKIGIVGFSVAGKTTVFNALTGLGATVGGYSDPGKINLGTIKVPDDRLDWLTEIYHPRKVTHAEIVFIDIPGTADRTTTALDRTTINQMRDADALVQVVRAFDSPLAGEASDPCRDIDNFKSELLLADLAIVEKRLDRLHKEKGAGQEIALMDRCRAALESETALRDLEISEAEARMILGFGLLSRLPLLLVLNVGESAAAAPLPPPVQQRLDRDGLVGLSLCAQIEMEIAALAPEERGAFLTDLGLEKPARDRFIRAAYSLLNLISFFTTGEDDVHAWPVRRGTPAAKAAGKVHTDMERGFIRAEVIAYDEFVRHGSEAKCREAGKLRLEGKDYIVQDGDIVHFRFNV